MVCIECACYNEHKQDVELYVSFMSVRTVGCCVAAMAELRAPHVVAQDVTEIHHIFKYINVGSHNKPDYFSTICLVKKTKRKEKVKKMQEPDTPQRIIFASSDVTPEHGEWTLGPRGVNNELILRFNARFGKSGFEDTDF